MTIRHLLTMTAGLEWNENLPYADPNNAAIRMEGSTDWITFTIDPGQRGLSRAQVTARIVNAIIDR